MAEKNTPVSFSAENLNFSIGSQKILDNASLTVHEGERLGLIGRNGCGKTSFLKLLVTPQLPPGDGEIKRRRDLVIGHLPQDFELDHSLNVYDNISQGAALLNSWLHEYTTLPFDSPKHHELEQKLNFHNAWRIDDKIKQLIDALKVPNPKAMPDTLSGGEKRRVLLARELLREPDLLLLDEPTNHLDAETIEWLEDFIASYPAAFIVVTHDRYFLDRVCNGIVELSNGKFYRYDGNYSDFLQKKAEREHHIDAAEEKRRKFLKSELEWVRSNPKARTTRNQGRLQRYHDTAAIKDVEREREIDLLIPPPYTLGNKVALFQQVNFGFQDKPLLENFEFEFTPGTRLGIIGPNGSGKTTFLKLLTGALSPNSGKIEVADTVSFNYIDQERSNLNPDNSVLDEIGEGNDYVMIGERKISVWTYLRQFLFQDERINTKVAQLSGGEKARLGLAKQLKRGGNFIILDEPTNDLDLSTLAILEDALADYQGCVAVVSHDRFFLDSVCTHILAFSHSRPPLYGIGNYQYFSSMLKRNNASATAAAQPEKDSGKNNAKTKNPSSRKLSFKEQKEYDSIEDTIIQLEEQIADTEKAFSDPLFHTRSRQEQDALHSRHADDTNTLARLYARWEELEQIKTGSEQ